jgi:hypothetical protein
MRCLLIAFCFLLSAAPAYSQSKDSVYLFSYFKGNGEDGLHLAASEDGLTWRALKNDSSFLKPTVSKDKLMRDPCIIQGPDGTFHMVWTVSWNAKGIGYASSKDLINWSTQAFLPVMNHETGARNCWAPEIFYDQQTKTFLVYWATTITGKFNETKSQKESGYNHRMYSVTTKDFNVLSETKLFYNQGFNVIDATIVKNGKEYIMFLKDETVEPPQKNIRVARSVSFDKDYSAPGAPITGNYWAEGPTAIRLNGEWIVYFDKYRDHKMGAVKSRDLITWTDISHKVNFPEGVRHGTVFKVSRKIFNTLK